MDVAADGADEAAPENAAPMVTVDGTVYVLADSGGPWPETCPAGLVQAGEAELPDTGERCPYFAPPEDTGEIWVYQTCRDPETGTALTASKTGRRRDILRRPVISGVTAASIVFPENPRLWGERPRHRT